MQIVVKKKVLEELVDKVVKEVSSFHSVRIDEIPAKIDEEDIIKPAEEMATQLSQQKPPVDDESYVPKSKSASAAAAAALAEKVPQEKTEMFYKRLKDLVQSAKDGKDQEQLSEMRLNQIVSYLLGKPVRVNEAKGAAIDPRSPEGITLDTMMRTSDANVDVFTDRIERLDRQQHGGTSLARMAPMTMSGVYILLDAIAKKRGEQFKRPSDLQGVKDELLRPGSITLSDDLRKMKLRAMGTTVEAGGFGVALHNVTKEQMLAAAEQAIRNYFDALVEYITTGHLLGDPASGIKREREGTLRTEAKDVAKEVLIKLGEQLPLSAAVPEETLRNFADEIGDFIKNDLSPENNQFSYTFADLVIKVKKGKKGEEAEEGDEDAAEASSEQQVIIDLTTLAQDIQALPAEVSLFTRGDMTATGQTTVGEKVNTAAFFKDNVAVEIASTVEDLLNKFVKAKKSKFAAGDEGRNLASDILRRMGGSRSDLDPATVNLALQDPSLTGVTPEDTPEQIIAKQFEFLFKTDVLSRERFEMREQLFNAFMTDFFNPAVFMASKQFENSREVSVQFQDATSFNIGQVDDAAKGGLPYEIYGMYMSLLKQFGDKQARIPFFATYNKILNNPEFSQFVADISGKTGLSDLSRSKESFFDKDTTLILVVHLASEFAKRKLRQPTSVAILTGKSGEENGEYNIARAFARFCEQEVIEAAEDGVPDAVKMIDKVADLMEESGMGFVRIKKKKGAGKVNEIAKLRSMIRHAIR